jgi:hypothetical protein
MFFATGFLGGYTMTRLFLAGAFGRADQDAIGTTIAVDVATEGYSPGDEAKKILSTLWKHQDKDNRQKRWTFTVLPGTADYSRFREGVDELFKHGFVTFTPEGQVMLSDHGFDILSKDSTKLTGPETYVF